MNDSYILSDFVRDWATGKGKRTKHQGAYVVNFKNASFLMRRDSDSAVTILALKDNAGNIYADLNNINYDLAGTLSAVAHPLWDAPLEIIARAVDITQWECIDTERVVLSDGASITMSLVMVDGRKFVTDMSELKAKTVMSLRTLEDIKLHGSKEGRTSYAVFFG